MPQVMPEYSWNNWVDPILFPYVLPVTQIALTGARATLPRCKEYCHIESPAASLLWLIWLR